MHARALTRALSHTYRHMSAYLHNTQAPMYTLIHILTRPRPRHLLIFTNIHSRHTYTLTPRTHIHTQSSLHLCKDPPSLEPSSSQCALVSTEFTTPEWLQRSVQHEGLQILKVKSLLHRRKSLSVVRPLGPTMSEC